MREQRFSRRAVRPLVVAAVMLALAAPAAAAQRPGKGDNPFGAAPKRSWYFAEGTTGYGFEEYICVQNPTPFDATVRATYMMPADKGQKAGDPFVLAADSRATINVADVTPGTDVSVRVDADQDVVCERSMYWGGRIEGHDSIGVTAPNTKWYLAEGCTNYGFEEYVSIQNPGTVSSSVTFTYNTATGPRKKPAFSVAPRSRKTVKVNDDVAPGDVSVTVSATGRVVAERSMYWDGRRGGHASIGTISPSGQWFLAEGSTKWGFDTFVLVQNPSTTDAQVNMIFLTDAGPVGAPPLLVKAGTRQTVDARAIVGNADFSTSINSKQGIICERSMYWNNGTGRAGHDTIGVKEAKLNCFLAEGTTLYGFETFVLIANPNNAENSVIVTYLTPTGVEPRGEVIIPPYSRTTIYVNADLPGRDVSIKLEGDLPIAAERAMYWNNRGGGHDSIGYTTN